MDMDTSSTLWPSETADTDTDRWTWYRHTGIPRTTCITVQELAATDAPLETYVTTVDYHIYLGPYPSASAALAAAADHIAIHN